MIYMDKPTGGRQKGQALVELALTLPLILLLVLGAMDFGRMFTTKLVLNNAAREGAYYISTYSCDPLDPDDPLFPDEPFPKTKQAATFEAKGLGVAIDRIEVNCEIINGCCARGTQATVSVTQEDVDLIFDVPLQALGLITGEITLTGSVSMVVQ